MEMTGERFMPKMKGVIELEHLNRYYFVINQLDLRNKIVVDLASGEGYGSNILSQYAENVIGIDISSEAVEHAKLKYFRTNLEFQQGDATNIPLPDNYVDVFVSFETIEHHDKHEQMMSEIKRVLKLDGILIISSPDKYYYSDVPELNNQFHVRELYYEEFKTLLNTYFKSNFFFSQSVFSGSIITADFENIQNKIPVVTDLNNKTTMFTPVYNIAICSDDELFKPIYLHSLFGETKNILTTVDIDKAQQTIKSSMEFRLGRKILKIFSFIKKFIK